MNAERRAKIDRALRSLKAELDALEDLSENLTVRVRASQETAEKLRRMAHELRTIDPGEGT